jgi:hypothetical protein
MAKVWKVVREFFFSKANKELALFIFFLALSGIFWLVTTLNETYEKEFAIPVSIAGIPKNAVLTSDETDTIKVTIRDKGFLLISYEFGDVIKTIRPPFRTYSRNNGMGVVPAADLKKIISQQLSTTSVITAVKPEKLEFYYNYGNKKRVPIRWSGRVIPEELYYISRVDYSPDSVTIYASDEKLDSINMIYTEPLNYANFRDTLVAQCEVGKIRGVKVVPDRVKVTFITDLLTEERIDGIPIQCLNMPEGKVLRTFPAKVAVRFVTGASIYRTLRPEDFTVYADYEEIRKHPTEKCRIFIKDVPRGISRARLDVTLVDYLIESEEP